MSLNLELQLLKDLCEFFRKCDKTEMVKIYGDNLGAHLWGKFNFLSRDWAHWLCSLDFNNLEKLVKHIKSKRKEC